MNKLSHVNEDGAAHMVDVGSKAQTLREAVAEGYLIASSDTIQAIMNGNAPKGDVLGTARLAGIMAAKKTADLIPLCHPLALTKISVDIEQSSDERLRVLATVRTTAQTGVEMEALTAVSVSLLTLYDMAKAVDKSMQMGDIRLLRKTGGKSGDYDADTQKGGG